MEDNFAIVVISLYGAFCLIFFICAILSCRTNYRNIE